MQQWSGITDWVTSIHVSNVYTVLSRCSGMWNSMDFCPRSPLLTVSDYDCATKFNDRRCFISSHMNRKSASTYDASTSRERKTKRDEYHNHNIWYVSVYVCGVEQQHVLMLEWMSSSIANQWNPTAQMSFWHKRERERREEMSCNGQKLHSVTM